MSNWISSKLKVAESFLQQIDQQAAESLRKGDRSRSEAVDGDHAAPERSSESVPLKEQLRTRASLDKNGEIRENASGRVSTIPARSAAKPDSAAAVDTDWTELLGSPDSITSAGRSENGIGVPGPGKGRKNAGGVTKSTSKPSNVAERKAVSLAGRSVINEEAGFSGRTGRSNFHRKDAVKTGDSMPQGLSELRLTEEISNDLNTPMKKTGFNLDLRGVIRGEEISSPPKGQTDGVVGQNERRNYKKESPSYSDRGSDFGSDSTASSDSEDEVERKRRAEQILAEERSARALEALEERENVVARLKGEQFSLEKILEEREKQQALEASELQLSTIEKMEAVELEKQKLDSTRMEALSRLTELETTNTKLAKSLAATQRNLEIEVNRVAEVRQRLEYKEMTIEDIRRSISKSFLNLTSSEQTEESKQNKLERTLLEADYAFTCDKIAQLQEKANALTKDIETTQREIEEPSQVEIELKKRLAQLTDHLIQKQAQVEAFASEKATLSFRIEAVTRLIDEEKVAEQMTNADDIEAGTWEASNSKLKPMLRRKIRSSGRQLWSILKQLDSIFSAGSVFIRRNPKAQIWSLVYLVCLHLWVMYIFVLHSQVSEEPTSGAVISLDSINKTTGG